MPRIDLRIDGEGAWPDLVGKRRAGGVIDLGDDAVIGIAALAGGMQSGRASVAFRFDLPNGRTVFVQTSLRTLHAAVMAIVARHGEPFMQPQQSAEGRELRIALAARAMTEKLLGYATRRGEAPTLDFTEAEAVFDEQTAELARLRAEVARLRQMAGEGA